MAEEAKRTGAWLVHYSTDYVYDGTSPNPYREDDHARPLGTYGRTKLDGDQAVQAVDGDYLIFRLCWVYGARGRNFLRTIERLARERETLRVVNDQIGCPTPARLIAEATALCLLQVLNDDDRSACRGVYHLATSGQTSWHGFAEAIVSRLAKETRKCRVVEAISSAEYPMAARRPANSVLDCQKLRRTFGIRLPGWEEGLDLVMEEFGGPGEGALKP
jgi:dTDP-4-dehydrorhamnose reductase